MPRPHEELQHPRRLVRTRERLSSDLLTRLEQLRQSTEPVARFSQAHDLIDQQENTPGQHPIERRLMTQERLSFPLPLLELYGFQSTEIGNLP